MIKVLVVDDSALVRKLFGGVLSNESGFEVQFARNGVEALDRLETFRPDVITLDVDMPQMNGLECLDRIMVERPCPVVMVSALTAAGADSTLEALRLGAVDFVPKPGGAVSMHIDAFAPLLVEKVRTAASARLRASLRLKDRVKHQISGRAANRRGPQLGETRAAAYTRAKGDGLVLVGTSTGGPPALEALLTPLKSIFPWPILIAQHMPVGFTGPLAARLDKLCSLHVVEATTVMAIETGHVYLARGNADMIVSHRPGGLVVMPAPAIDSYPWHPSADRLVRSAMEHVETGQLVGVLMTGMGDDGAKAMAQLRANGGRTIAEAEETAIVWGMPGELVKAGGADWVLPLPEIATRLQSILPSHAAHA